MTPERWQQVEKIFHEALEYHDHARTDFLARACGEDSDLRLEVETLLAAEEAPIGIQAVVDKARSLVHGEQTKNLIGLQLGPYKILSQIGSGGVGIVYLAEDTRLGRKVAVKMLSAYFIKDETALHRFETEARTASALSHPNMITIHDVGEFDHVPYVVSEYVEGHTLSMRILQRHLSPMEIIDIAMQIADALDEAHSRGIIHRDIKPDNIMLTPRGQVKVLDFGLARMLQSTSKDRKTLPGTVLGTVSYMSPEQASGKEMDHRTDLFALGAVLYEMLSSKLPFDADSYEEIIAKILKEDPPEIDIHGSELAARLEQIARRLLEKDRDRRYQSARELTNDLKILKMNTDAALLSKITLKLPFWRRSPRKRMAFFAWMLVFVLIAGAVVGTWMYNRRGSESSFGKATFTQLTDHPGEESFPSLAPDGRSFVYESGDDIFLQHVGGSKSINLTPDSPDVDSHPAFSPDGNWIAFYSKRDGGGIFIMSASGKNVTEICDFGFNPAWSPDGKQIVIATDPVVDPSSRGRTSQLWVVDLATRQKHPLYTGDAVQPSWSPHGQRIAYWGLRGGQRDIWTASSKGGDAIQVTDDPFLDFNPVWSPDGRYLYFTSDRGGSINFWRIRIEEGSGRTSGIAEPVTTPSELSRDMSISSDGKHIAFTKVLSRQNLQKAQLDPDQQKIIGTPVWISQSPHKIIAPDLSPDGQWIVFISGGTKEDICVMKADGSGFRQLTNDLFKDRVPKWSPDGKEIAFYSDRSGHYEIWVIRPDGSGLKQLTNVAGPIVAYPIWSPDSKKIAYASADLRVYIMERDKPWSKNSVRVLPWAKNTKSWFNLGSWSPDGTKIIGWIDNLDPPERTGLVVYSFATKSYTRVMDYGLSPTWLNDSRNVIFRSREKILLLDTEARALNELITLSPYVSGACLISQNNREIVYSQDWVEADIWLMSLEEK